MKSKFLPFKKGFVFLFQNLAKNGFSIFGIREFYDIAMIPYTEDGFDKVCEILQKRAPFNIKESKEFNIENDYINVSAFKQNRELFFLVDNSAVTDILLNDKFKIIKTDEEYFNSFEKKENIFK
ncbi:hypothetical protein [Tenacibaculum sp. C7A-26P2]|uniref:hypothetical protein n=1 Tax=Tenacibaculum sp. C7A-26P2 TaxID=3447504 RepID=UPI003F8571BC